MADINTLTGGDEGLKSRIEGLTPEQKAKLLEILKQDIESNENKQENIEPNPNLFGNKEAILKDLKENYVKVEENAEMMGEKGKKVHIELPAVGNFEGFKFDYFVSDKQVELEDFENNPEFEKKSYSMKEIGHLLQAINGYMKELGIEIDENMDYENGLQAWYKPDKRYKKHFAGYYLNELTGLEGTFCYYWLSDTGIEDYKPYLAGNGANRNRAELNFDGFCYFTFDGAFDDRARLLLKLSD